MIAFLIIGILNHWWILVVFKAIILYFLLKKTYFFYKFDKAGMYDNTSFFDELSKFGGDYYDTKRVNGRQESK